MTGFGALITARARDGWMYWIWFIWEFGRLWQSELQWSSLEWVMEAAMILAALWMDTVKFTNVRIARFGHISYLVTERKLSQTQHCKQHGW